MTLNRSIWPFVVGPLLILSIPLVAMRYSTSVAWSAGDFMVAAGLLYAAVFGWWTLLKASIRPSSRLAGALMVGMLLMEVWANLAVGIIGDPDHSVNRAYDVLVLAAFGGLVWSRFQSVRMQWVVLVTACGHLLVAFLSVGLIEAHLWAEQWRLIVLFNGIALSVYAIIWGLYRWSLRSPVEQPVPGELY